ncbi:MAG: ATP-dependent helicase HrpB, partial [Actinomycetota bacterium]|nr:ATP-dependent helicase HrpB [Actinomycetota bacterium]
PDGRPTAIGRRMAELPLHPRLAHLVVRSDGAADACALAALLEDRDVLRGHPDELPLDVGERVRLIVDTRARHPLADRQALASARRRAQELVRRSARHGRVTASSVAGVDLDSIGALLALAYPDRISQARGNGRFRFRSGGGAWVPATDPLGQEPFLVAAEIQPDGRADGRIRLAAAIDVDDVLAVAGDAVLTVATLAWDPVRDDLRARTEHRLGGLVLTTSEGPADPDDLRTVPALVDRVRATGLAALPWTESARDLQRRNAFARRHRPVDAWADLGDAALSADLADWLTPVLTVRWASSRSDLDALDVTAILRQRLGGSHIARRLDEVVPRTLTLARGRSVAISYDPRPTVAVRVQDAFGTGIAPGSHPTVAGEPIVFELLSPAQRPVQITADLPGFWTGSWAAVRKELAGRYPKHAWPVDPTADADRRSRG